VASQTEIFSMKDRNFRPDEPNVLYVGEGATVKGDISVPDLVIIAGHVEGSVMARSIYVGPSGSVKGTVVVMDADIYGTVTENLEVKQLLLVRACGRIDGQVSYGELELEKGATISGGFSSTEYKSDKKKAEAPSKVERLRASSGKFAADRNVSGDRQQTPLAEVDLAQS
jgi:cytoskeletal protein CcmA (bactofilin family)